MWKKHIFRINLLIIIFAWILPLWSVNPVRAGRDENLRTTVISSMSIDQLSMIDGGLRGNSERMNNNRLLETPSPGTEFTEHFIQYDEQDWVHYPLDEYKYHNGPDRIYDIAFAQDGSVWVASLDGLWNISGNDIKHYGATDFFLQGNNKENAEMEDIFYGPYKKYHVTIFMYDYDTLNKVLVNQDVVWVTHGNIFSDLITYGNDVVGWKNYDVGGVIRDFTISDDGIVWVLNKHEQLGNCLSYYKGGVWHRIILPSMGIPEMEYFSIISLVDGGLVLNSDHGLYFYDKGKLVEETIIKPSLIYEDRYITHLNYLFPTKDGKILSLFGEGLMEFDFISWETIFINEELMRDMESVDVSDDGRIWIINSYIEKTDRYIFNDLPFYQIHSIKVAPDSTVWYGTDSGVYIYKNGTSQ